MTFSYQLQLPKAFVWNSGLWNKDLSMLPGWELVPVRLTGNVDNSCLYSILSFVESKMVQKTRNMDEGKQIHVF